MHLVSAFRLPGCSGADNIRVAGLCADLQPPPRLRRWRVFACACAAARSWDSAHFQRVFIKTIDFSVGFSRFWCVQHKFEQDLYLQKNIHTFGTTGRAQPHWHCCTDLEPFGDFFPEGQSLGLEDPSGQYLFAGHLVGAETPFVQNDPSGQSTDEVAVGQ